MIGALGTHDSHPGPGTVRIEPSVSDAGGRIQRLRIVVIDGPDRGLDVSPDRPVLRVGTHEQAEIALHDPTVSRFHCELALAGPRVRVTDMGSANGTSAAGVRFERAEIPLGTLLRVGETTLRITTDDQLLEVPLSDSDRFGRLFGRSAAMREVFAILERVAATSSTVLLEGESGTGKELAAQAIHQASPRRGGPFTVFDCGAVPPSLVESLLWGHVRGAFTGAVADRQGLFEEADGGTLFLDEIGDLPLELQPKLLRALEQRAIRRIGATTTTTVDVRIVAATNRRLEADVNRGRFREDLYYRLAVVKVTLPPLRERPQDIPLLVDRLLEELAPGAARPGTLTAAQLASLALRPWPGNVRELRNVVERMLALTSGPDSPGPAPRLTAAAPEVDLAVPLREARARVADAFTRRYLERALARSGGNVSAVARDAGLSRKMVQKLMRRFALR